MQLGISTSMLFHLQRHPHYWNFEAYQESQDLDAHYAQFHASRFVATDGKSIPTGELRAVDNTPMDFRKAKFINSSILETTLGGFCGTGELCRITLACSKIPHI